MSKRLTPEQRAELTLALNGLGVLTVQRMRSGDKFTWTQPEIAGTAGRMQPEIANALATITKLAPQALDDLEALEKANDGSIERSYREASKVAIDILWSEHPEIPYESPKQVLEWLKVERDTLRAQLEECRNAVRNQRGDDLCWIQNPENAEVAKALPEAEFLESCRRYHAQLKSERGEFAGGRTIAQLEADNAALRAQLEREKANHEDTASVRDYHENTVAALRARCEQLQRENEALVHGAEAGPTR